MFEIKIVFEYSVIKCVFMPQCVTEYTKIKIQSHKMDDNK